MVSYPYFNFNINVAGGQFSYDYQYTKRNQVRGIPYPDSNFKSNTVQYYVLLPIKASKHHKTLFFMAKILLLQNNEIFLLLHYFHPSSTSIHHLYYLAPYMICNMIRNPRIYHILTTYLFLIKRIKYRTFSHI